MILSMVLGAAKPWTHWMAPPLLAGAVLYVVSVGIAYYCKIQAPWYRSRLLRERQQAPVIQLRRPAAASSVARHGRPRPDQQHAAAA